MTNERIPEDGERDSTIFGSASSESGAGTCSGCGLIRKSIYPAAALQSLILENDVQGSGARGGFPSHKGPPPFSFPISTFVHLLTYFAQPYLDTFLDHLGTTPASIPHSLLRQ